jgi:spore germination protein GerM
MKSMHKLLSKKQVFVLFVLIVLFLLSSLVYIVTNKGSRRVFFFPDYQGRFYTEVRYLAKKQANDAVTQYIAELLLGPAGERVLALFSPGTRIISCFVREKTLYLDISEHALFAVDNTAAVKDGAALLTKNILRNFGFIDSVELYINNIRAYENYDENE